MGFQRARNQDQKNIRIQQICDAADKLLRSMPYDRITLSGIAANLSFTRANLYKYFSTKEEIYLALLLRRLTDWVDDLHMQYDGLYDIPTQQFAEIWADTLIRHQQLIEIFSFLYSIIEQNVSVDTLAAFKIQSFQIIQRLHDMIASTLPALSSDNIRSFIHKQQYYAMGLYPATQQTHLQKAAVEKAGLDFHPPDFQSDFQHFVVLILDGLLQSAT